MRPLLLSVFTSLLLSAAGAAPAVYWASDPVQPGETVLVCGEGFGDSPQVSVVRLEDEAAESPPDVAPVPVGEGVAAQVLEASETSVKFLLPEQFAPGMFRYVVTGQDGAAPGMLNAPAVWWVQGDLGTRASPGGWLRLFGKNLGGEKGKATRVWLRGPVTLALQAEADRYAARVALPADLAVGEYEVRLHNGMGGGPGWSEPQRVTVQERPHWPERLFNVREFGAQGGGTEDDTPVVQAALDEAEANGGGVVYFPRGRYQITQGLRIPRFTVLRGESRELTCLFWPDTQEPPEALLQGTNCFGVEELTIYASNHRHVIAGDLGDKPDAGNVFLRNLRVRADAYRGHLEPAQVDGRLRQSLQWSTGGGDTVRLGGDNIEISGCDLYGSGRVLFLSRTRGGVVRDNTLYNGRWGWYCISGSDGLVFEDNRVIGADLMSTGGGLNCLDGSAYSQNVYYARNKLSMMHGWDREAMTTDAGGEVYFGKVARVEGANLVLTETPNWDRDWRGAAVFIHQGRGAGQYRRLVSYDGPTVTVDRPWAVEPDADSLVGITMHQGHYLIIDNEFTDTGALQFFGTSVECLVAGNRGTRMQHMRSWALWYYGYQPSWYCQYLGNHIVEGNYYHGVGDQWGAPSYIGVYGAQRAPLEAPLLRGAVIRGNRLDNNAQLRVDGLCKDVVIERNRIADTDVGVWVDGRATDVVVRANEFEKVAEEVVDEVAARKTSLERVQRLLGRHEPVAVWSFESADGGRIEDSSGNGFAGRIVGGVTVVSEGVHGQAARFDGTGYVRIEGLRALNPPEMTISLWVKPEALSGRRGLVSKRMGHVLAPYILSQSGAAIAFEASEESGQWTHNFTGPAVLKQNAWTHVAAVLREGEGITLYANGAAVAEKRNPAKRVANYEPLILGREVWGGDPPRGETPGFYIGLLDEVKLWARALSADEVRAECESAMR